MIVRHGHGCGGVETSPSKWDGVEASSPTTFQGGVEARSAAASATGGAAVLTGERWRSGESGGDSGPAEAATGRQPDEPAEEAAPAGGAGCSSGDSFHAAWRACVFNGRRMAAEQRQARVVNQPADLAKDGATARDLHGRRRRTTVARHGAVDGASCLKRRRLTRPDGGGGGAKRRRRRRQRSGGGDFRVL
ncbi:hypothetical protein Syun_001354 [Stephania yunnanensis]|uniref:Uncharacterized protein n=1 Tax=Stephania yunnanensis TaxID=152371 RepID=A0AAP0LHM8_9MAGN